FGGSKRDLLFGVYKIIDADHLTVGVEGGMHKKIGGVEVFPDHNIEVELFFEFTDNTFFAAFPEFESASRKLRDVMPFDELIRHKDFVILDQNAVDSYIKSLCHKVKI
ncbi:MAG: hypothetical protein K0S12_1829, partial [Bacteroidetes bacterium]|nr:hypothetical protein [Bacteroidota bacterium]